MHPVRHRQVLLNQPLKLRPSHLAALTAPTQSLTPCTTNLMPKPRQPLQVVGYGKVIEVAAHDALKPFANELNRLVTPTFQCFANRCKRSPHPLLHGQAQDFERPVAILRATVRKTKKVESLRPSQSAPFPALLSVAAKFNQSRFLGMKRQSKFAQASLHLFEKPFRKEMQ